MPLLKHQSVQPRKLLSCTFDNRTVEKIGSVDVESTRLHVVALHARLAVITDDEGPAHPPAIARNVHRILCDRDAS